MITVSVDLDVNDVLQLTVTDIVHLDSSSSCSSTMWTSAVFSFTVRRKLLASVSVTYFMACVVSALLSNVSADKHQECWYLSAASLSSFSVSMYSTKYQMGPIFTVRYMPWPCVCLCLSQVGVLLKWLNIGTRQQRHTIAQGLLFWC